MEPPDLGPWAWQAWTYDWAVTEPGDYVLCARARDAAGNAQTDLPDWNLGGYANPAPQRSS